MLAHDAKTDAFDMAIGGISRTPQRKEELILSDSYLETGKTILCREADAARFGSLADVDRPGVRVLYNPGGTNEDFSKRIFIMPTAASLPGMPLSRTASQRARRMS